MATVQLRIPAKLAPVFEGEADVRGAKGGRGSAKTRTFAKMTAVRALMWAKLGRTGIILCGREHLNSLADSSMAEVKEAIRSEPWLADEFDIGETYIRTKCRRIEYVFAGLRHNLASIKSKAKILLAWIDEAEPVSEEAWRDLIPTLREEDSELWVTWNPKRRKSATQKRFGGVITDVRVKIVTMNWRDNPWFPAILNRTRLKDLEERPDSYEHVWEGDFVSAAEGAYFSRWLAEAKLQSRIGRVGADPLMTYRAVWDIGGTGAKADACAIWIVQWIGREIRVLDYYEAQGQPLATHIAWLRERKYDKALCILPHDGDTNDRVYDVSFASALEQAQFETLVIPNQGKGAAKMRIESARRLFGSIWFNEDTTVAGREALGWYHEKRDDERDVGLGPEHDWSSHGADAFGLMCVAYEAPPANKPVVPEQQRPSGANSWMA